MQQSGGGENRFTCSHSNMWKVQHIAYSLWYLKAYSWHSKALFIHFKQIICIYICMNS